MRRSPVAARRSRRFRLAAALLSAAGCLAVVAAPAQAGLLVADAPSCDTLAQSQVFLPWADLANYELAPGGTLENGSAGWSLSGGAAVTSGNESYGVNSASDSSSLALPDPSTATTGETCVGIDHPTLRFFARQTAGSPTAILRVDVEWEDGFGVDHWTTMGTNAAGSSWAPSPVMLIAPSLLPLLPGQMTPVAFRFVPQGGDFQVDDVYVDPYGKG